MEDQGNEYPSENQQPYDDQNQDYQQQDYQQQDYEQQDYQQQDYEQQDDQQQTYQQQEEKPISEPKSEGISNPTVVMTNTEYVPFSSIPVENVSTFN